LAHTDRDPADRLVRIEGDRRRHLVAAALAGGVVRELGDHHAGDQPAVGREDGHDARRLRAGWAVPGAQPARGLVEAGQVGGERERGAGAGAVLRREGRRVRLELDDVAVLVVRDEEQRAVHAIAGELAVAANGRLDPDRARGRPEYLLDLLLVV